METCRNCEAALSGPYCSQCGQKHSSHRLNLPELVSHAFEAITEVDSALWRTVRECTLNPGRVALNYIAGQHARYVNPVKFFLTIFAVYVGALAMTGMLDLLADEAVHFGEGTNMQSPVVQTAMAVRAVLRTHFNLIFFVALPLIAFALRWQYWRAGRNYAETLTFLCYLGGIISLYALPFLPVFYLMHTYSGTPRGIILVVLFTVGARTFFEMSWLKTFGGFLVSFLLYLICTSLAATLLAWAQMAGLL